MAIYTKTGDKGETGLVSLDRIKTRRTSKDSTVIKAIGAIDELNSYLGVCLYSLAEDDSKDDLLTIQHNLFTIGSILAGSDLKLNSDATRKLERKIDSMEASLPVLKNFILPGGGELGSHLHYARSLTRKAERALVSLYKEIKFSEEILRYINRLSDFLFCLARDVNFKEAKPEIKWTP